MELYWNTVISWRVLPGAGGLGHCIPLQGETKNSTKEEYNPIESNQPLNELMSR